MRRAPLAAAVVLAALAAGCGDSSKSGGSTTVDAGKPAEVKADEYSFRPSTITVRGGGGAAPARVTFKLVNQGSLPHDLTVRQGKAERGGTQVAAGGKTAEATVLLKPGDYEIFCSIGDHEQLGMKGKLHVQ